MLWCQLPQTHQNLIAHIWLILDPSRSCTPCEPPAKLTNKLDWALPASFTPTSNGFVEGKSLLVVFDFYFFPTPLSGPPWNEGHWPRVHHETSVLEVLAPGTTRTLLLFKFY